MFGAKMGHVDYISRNLFAKTKKFSSYFEHFVLATISKFQNCLKHLIKRKLQTEENLDNILKLHSLFQTSSRLIAPQAPNLYQDNSHIRITAIAS